VAYQKGLGVAVDLAQAHKWLSMAAAAGNTKAQEADKLVEAKMQRDGIAAAEQPKQSKSAKKAEAAETAKKSAPAKKAKK